MKDLDLGRFLLPEEVYQHFDLVDIHVGDNRVDLYLDEKAVVPIGGSYTSKGFTDAHSIQDFPLRGKPVYLHVRRRKWLDNITKQVTTNSYDLTHLGTQLTEEFAAFLKGIDRRLLDKY